MFRPERHCGVGVVVENREVGPQVIHMAKREVGRNTDDRPQAVRPRVDRTERSRGPSPCSSSAAVSPLTPNRPAWLVLLE